MSAVDLDRLTFVWPGAGRPAVDDVSLLIAPGTLTVVVGPSGCGKSTLLRLVAGLETPSAGRVRFDGEDVTGIAPERRGAAMMVQDTLLFPHMDVRDNVSFGLRMRGVGRSEAARTAEEMLTRVHLAGIGDRWPNELSGGQAQRVSLARALVVRPRVLLLDEPLSALDPELRAELGGEVRTILHETGTTALLVSHDRQEAVALADRMALLVGGSLVQAGPPADLFERPRSRVAAAFFGASNVIEGRCSGGSFDGPLGRLDLADPGPDGPATVVIRPEAISLADDKGRNVVEATVTESRYHGTRARVRAVVGRIGLVADVDARAGCALQPGDRVLLRLPADRLWRIPDDGHGRDSS